jgi:cation:H+ antiporter
MALHVVVIVLGGAAVWWAGTWLSRDADDFAEATGVGRVLVGALLLGVATSLPEVATTVMAGILGNPSLAMGNLMGGVALQVVVLAVADVVESNRRLTYQVSSPGVLVQHVVLLLLLGLTMAGMALGEPVTVGGIGLWPVAIAAVFMASLGKVRRAERDGAWEVGDSGPTLGRGAGEPGDDEVGGVARPPAWRLAALAGVLLVAGGLVARSGDALSQTDLLSGTFVGAALVALTTSLPELSTVIGALRRGAYDMAVANIVGTNGLEVALLLPADIAYRDGALLAHAARADLFLVALASVLTCLYLGGLLLRGRRTVLRIGRDSLLVLLVYGGGMALLATTG